MTIQTPSFHSVEGAPIYTPVPGPQGAQGVQGDTGPQGPEGVQGPQGEAGPQGIQGSQGNTGAQGIPGNSVVADTYATVAAIAALPIPTSAAPVVLSHATRGGLFVFDASNLSTQVSADTQQGLYIAPASDATGASGAWVRRFSGLADFRWFGSVADMTADGVGTNNTPMFDAARAALVAASKSWLHIPQQAAAYRFSTAPAAIHDGVLITGERHYQNPGQVGVTTYVGIRKYPGTVLGFAPDVPGFKLVAYTDNASNAPAFEYQSAHNSAIRDLMLYSEGGTGTTSHGIELFVKVNLDNLDIQGFAGSGLKISGDDTGGGGTANQYGNPINSHVQNVMCTFNKLHGFHVTGNNGNVILFTDCTAQLNGGVGYLDQGAFGNGYTNCLAATNNASFGTPGGYSAAQRTQVIADYAGLATQINGSFVGVGGVAAHTYTACYVEVGNGSYPDIGYQSVVSGGQLANYTWQFNIGTNGNPTINSGRGVDTPALNFTTGQANATVAFDHAKIYRHADRGLVLQGAPASIGSYDVTIVNKSDAPVLAVNTGTTTARFLGTLQVDSKNILLNGASAFPGIGITSQSVMFTSATNGLNLAGWGSSYDLVLGNKTNQIALRVPTGTQNVELPGNLTVSGSGTVTGDVTTSGGLRAKGAPTGAAGLAVDVYSDGANGIVQAYNSTSAAYAALFIKGSPISFYPNGGTLMFSVTTTGATLAGTFATTGLITSSGATGGIGYATGAGGTVTQATSKSTGVTLSKVCGQITMNAAALASAAGVSFTVTNTTVAATDTIDLVLQSGNATAGTYNYQIDKVSAGSFVIWVKNISAGSLSESLVFNFSVKKAVAA